MHKLKKTLLPLLLVLAMLLMSVTSFAASSPTGKKIKSVSFSPASTTYNGLKRTVDKVELKDENGNRINPKYYTITYKNNKNAGTATVIFTAKAPYTGTIKKTFKIKKAAAHAFIVAGRSKPKPDKTTLNVKLKDVKKLKKKKQIATIDLFLFRYKKNNKNTYVSTYNGLIGKYSVSKKDAPFIQLSVRKDKDKKSICCDVYLKKAVKKKRTFKITVKVQADGKNYKAVTRTVNIVVK